MSVFPNSSVRICSKKVNMEWHTLSHEQYFSKHRVLDICQYTLQFFCFFFSILIWCCIYLTLIERLFVASFILVSKFIFGNLLNSGVVIKLAVSGILFSISVAFLLRETLIARLVMLDI